MEVELNLVWCLYFCPSVYTPKCVCVLLVVGTAYFWTTLPLTLPFLI